MRLEERSGVLDRVPDLSARWPERIVELTAAWRSARDDQERDRALGELWTIVNLALQRYARAFARRFGVLDREELRDIAADKALDLLGRLDSPSWHSAASTPGEICAFLAGVARHGVVDRLRARGRELRWSNDRRHEAPCQTDEAGIDAAGPITSTADSAEHARAIAECAMNLTFRARRVWFLRVFHDLPSADIARHPDVASTPAAVDAMLMRCRKNMRACITTRGFDPSRIPPGTFARLWEMLER